MGFRYLSNMPLEEALESYMEKVRPKVRHKVEEITVPAALGRVSSEAVYAKISSPNFLCSAMDGIAVKAGDTFGATETSPVVLAPSQYRPIDTGDPVPAGFDAVVMIEEVISSEDGARLIAPATPWQNIRQIGEDLSAGEMVLPSDTRINPAAIGALLSTGITGMKVYRRPVVTIIPTGDEIVSALEGVPEDGKIIDSNSSMFAAMLEEMGCHPQISPIIPDQPRLLEDAILQGVATSEMVIVLAGSSAGRDDNTADVIDRLGHTHVHGLAIKPGKPTILGVVGEKPVVGLPGYPVSGMIVMDRLIRRISALYTKQSLEGVAVMEAVLTKRLMSSLKYKDFVRVTLGYMEGAYRATPIWSGAGVISAMTKADGILEIPQNVEGLEAGQKIRVSLLRTEEEIRKKVIILGSHDPLIDHLTDILKRAYDIPCTSTHQGSLAGIRAIDRGEAHMAGIHLLDGETGEYNVSWARKHLKGRKAVLVPCVKRQQGIMVRRGNPFGIEALSDLSKMEGLRFVNRQKGSGTRVLLDYLLKKEGMRPSELRGYDREEYTHLAVAASIAQGTADAGLGIYSAAQIYDLTFIPLELEQYDFLVSIEFYQSENFKKILEVLRSEEFSARLQKLGGYVLHASGTPLIMDGQGNDGSGH